MLKRIKEVEQRTNQPFWVNQRLLWFSVPAPFFLTKQSGLIKGHLIFLDVISGPRQFTGQGTMGHFAIVLLEFPVIERSTHRVVSPGMLGCFREGPGQIFIAIAVIAFTFDLVITDPLAGDQTTVRHVVTHFRKASDTTCFQKDRHGQNLSHPGNR